MHTTNDILVTIFSKLEAKSLANSEIVCSRWKKVIQEKKLWDNQIFNQDKYYPNAITSKQIYKKFFSMRKHKVIYNHDIFYLVGESTIIKALLNQNIESNTLFYYKNTTIAFRKSSCKHLILKSYASLEKYYLFDNVRDAEIYLNSKQLCYKGTIYLPALFEIKLHPSANFYYTTIPIKGRDLNCIEVVDKNLLTLLSGSVMNYKEDFIDEASSHNFLQNPSKACSII